MTFLGAPLATLLGAGGLAAASFVALYLLRPQRRRIDVPYARLWGLVVREARSSSIARRLRRWESLLLQLVIAALVLLALADPHLGQKVDRPRHVILVDVSASMQVGTRMKDARDAALRVVDSLSPDEEALLVAFDTEPRALSSLTRDDGELRVAARALNASDAPDDPLPALRLAADVLRGAGQPRLTLITDGALDISRLQTMTFGEAPDQLALGAVDVRAVSVGHEADNVAITGFSVRRYPANPSAYEILVEVRSYSSRPRKATLTLLQEGETVETTPLDLPPNARVQRRLADLSGDGRRLEARLAVEGGDALSVDDHAYALLPDRPRTRVLLVAQNDLYTEGALLLDRAIEVERVAPRQYDAAHAATLDAAVFAGWTPPSMPAVPSLYLGCDAPGCPFPTKGTMDAPIVTESERNHPLLRWVALKDMNVSRSQIFLPQPGDTSLASSLGRSLLVAGVRNGMRAAALGFAPSGSDLPLRVAFPVLLVNSLRWLTGHAIEATDEVRTGRRARLAAAGSLDLLGPDGTHVRALAQEGAAELTLRTAGFWTSGERPIAASLVDARESMITPQPLALGGKPLSPPSLAQRLSPRASLWRWLAGLALVLVVLEWWTFHRRWTV